MLYEYRVDIVLCGHLHGYERSHPVFNGSLLCDAPMYITVGDGGNHEGPARPWNTTTPVWTALREFSFGHGVLRLENATHGRWDWKRNQDSLAVSADVVALQTASTRCSAAAGADGAAEIS